MLASWPGPVEVAVLVAKPAAEEYADPTREDAAPGHEDAVPTRQDAAPVHEDAAPAHEDAAVGKRACGA